MFCSDCKVIGHSIAKCRGKVRQEKDGGKRQMNRLEQVAAGVRVEGRVVDTNKHLDQISNPGVDASGVNFNVDANVDAEGGSVGERESDGDDEMSTSSDKSRVQVQEFQCDRNVASPKEWFPADIDVASIGDELQHDLVAAEVVIEEAVTSTSLANASDLEKMNRPLAGKASSAIALRDCGLVMSTRWIRRAAGVCS